MATVRPSRRNPDQGWFEVDADEAELVSMTGFGQFVAKIMPLGLVAVLRDVIELFKAHRKQTEEDGQL